MSYPSIDQLQKALAQEVFHYAQDKKKAAGRALGTLVEVITFYVLKSWNFHEHIAIERPLPEYSNEDITHNVEYSLHPSAPIANIEFPSDYLPLSVAKIVKALASHGITVKNHHRKTHQLLSSDCVLRNACTIADEDGSFLVATLTNMSKETISVTVNRLFSRPFAIAECKRVGVEEGTRKGPQTIEKAKQGAYVARTVSSLQKIRLPSDEIGDSKIGGVFAAADGKLICKEYDDFIQEIVNTDNPDLLRRFILTVGVVSNHGNWFTSDNHNKELKVLAQSYDWLLFLTDHGLAEFINDLILKPSKNNEPVRKAFLTSYKGKSGANQFTKIQMAYPADQVLQQYFASNAKKVESWFNVIAPRSKTLKLLRAELRGLAGKNWQEIHR
ncbi:MAG: hypothetical protein HY884_06265 [Deltaproteobacteria bacterium]|nr:hypothetical protein [Deltaproteobacteria bacterium]